MKRSYLFTPLLLALIGASALAQPRVGTKMPEFQLQATNQQFYGIQEAADRISVLFFVGYS